MLDLLNQFSSTCLSSNIFSLLLTLSVTSHTKCFKHDVIVWQSSVANNIFNVFIPFTQENEFRADFRGDNTARGHTSKYSQNVSTSTSSGGSAN